MNLTTPPVLNARVTPLGDPGALHGAAPTTRTASFDGGWPLRDEPRAPPGQALSPGVAELHLETDEFGFAVDRTATVPLDTMIRVMLVYSDNAVPDWLLDRVGRKTYRATIREAGLTGQDLPQSIHGLFLSWINHEQPDLTWRRVMRLLGLRDSQYASHVQALVNAYQDDVWRSAELAWIGTFPSVPVQQESALANGLYPRGTARDYARIMAGVITKTFISDRVSELMLEQLAWPRDYLPESAAPFTVWGNKGGSLPGVLTDANFFVADQGDFAGKPRVANSVHAKPF